MMTRATAAGLVVACACTAGAALAAARQQPVIRSGINFIRVDAIVTDRRSGAPVTDLSPDDFEVLEDGERQTIETFRLVDITVPAAGELLDAAPIRSLDHQTREIQREDVRVIAVLLDDYHVARGRDLLIRETLANFVRQLNPRDLVAVLYPTTAVTDLVFSRDHRAVADALMRFRGRKYDYTPMNEYEARYALRPAAAVEDVRNQVSLSALRALSTHLGTLGEGRKTILFVSEGIAASDPNAPRDAHTRQFSQGVDVIDEMKTVFSAANRGNTSIYTIDPRGLASSVPDLASNVSAERHRAFLRETTDSLRIMAGETGGRAIVRRNDLLVGLRQMLQDSSSYYLIGYSSTRSPVDGKFHEIRVRVKRPGVEVRARKGYRALTADSAARAATSATRLGAAPPPDVNEALSVLAAPGGGRPARTWVGLSRAEDGGTTVLVLWEALAGGGRPPAEQAARVSVTASDAAGALLFRGTGDVAAGPPAGGAIAFSAPPGPVRLRIAVEGPDGTVHDTETRTIEVPDYSAAGIAIGTPRLFRARTARDIAVLRAGTSARPTLSRTFSRLERLLLRFDAWGPGGVAPVVTARMLNARGEPVIDLPAPQPAAGGGYEIDIPLAPYAPNDYLIELSSGRGSGAVRVLTALRIL